MNETVLNPCPTPGCKGTPQFQQAGFWGWVQCSKCGLSTPKTQMRTHADNLWNRMNFDLPAKLEPPETKAPDYLTQLRDRACEAMIHAMNVMDEYRAALPEREADNE